MTLSILKIVNTSRPNISGAKTKKQETCGVINAWNENGQSDDDDYSVLSARTIYDQNGLETNK